MKQSKEEQKKSSIFSPLLTTHCQTYLQLLPSCQALLKLCVLALPSFFTILKRSSHEESHQYLPRHCLLLCLTPQHIPNGMQESQEHTAAQPLVTKLVHHEKSQGSGKEVIKTVTRKKHQGSSASSVLGVQQRRKLHKKYDRPPLQIHSKLENQNEVEPWASPFTFPQKVFQFH